MTFALVALLPEPKDDPSRLDFVSREFEAPADVAALIGELETAYPKWRIVSICHVEDLPLLMEAPGS